MHLSIIIVNWNVKDLLYKCLQSIFLFTKNINFEVIVVDNDSNDGSREMLREWAAKNKNTQVIFNKENVGFSKANNQGLAMAKGKYVLFMNPDMELVENTGKLLFDFMEKMPSVGVCTCRLQYPDGSEQPNIKRDPNFFSQIWILYKLHHLYQPKFLKRYLACDFDYNNEQEVEQIMGAFVFIKKEVIKKIGGWSQDYFIWWEDVDLCTRLRKVGERIIYTPKSRVIHHESKSFAQQLSFAKQKIFNKSMLIYFQKYHSRLDWFVLKMAGWDSLVLSLLAQIFKFKPKTQSRL